jgi:hypothetical protein
VLRALLEDGGLCRRPLQRIVATCVITKIIYIVLFVFDHFVCLFCRYERDHMYSMHATLDDKHSKKPDEALLQWKQQCTQKQKYNFFFFFNIFFFRLFLGKVVCLDKRTAFLLFLVVVCLFVFVYLLRFLLAVSFRTLCIVLFSGAVLLFSTATRTRLFTLTRRRR